MFVLPVSEEETDRVDIKDNGITLKSYGLPMIFWGYLGAILTVLIAMALAVKGPIVKLYNTEDTINKVLAISAGSILSIIPFSSLCFYFYEKCVTKKGDTLTLTHKIFWLPILRFKYQLQAENPLEIRHHMDSPNIAKLQQDPTMKGFENKGYFQLFAKTKTAKMILVDRSSRKADLKKILELLNSY